MITKTLKDLVKKEAKNLLIHATEEERAKLDFDYFDPDHQRRCVYGQMVGQCTYERAGELIALSCERVFKRKPLTDGDITSNRILNGKPKVKERDMVDFEYFSPIEIYILEEGAKNKELIEYLRGERKTLKL